MIGYVCCDCGHKFIYPAASRKFYDKSEYHVNERRESRADEKAEIAYRHGYRARESREHRAEEREGRT